MIPQKTMKNQENQRNCVSVGAGAGHAQNCRNTEQIGKRTSVLTLVAPAKHMKISGPKVVSQSYKTNLDLVKALRKDLSSLFAGGTPAEDVVILSKYKLNNSGIVSQRCMCNMEIKEVYDIARFQRNTLNFFTVQSFKGLESKIVFYIDVDGFKSVQDRMINYVAMSRAKIMLYIYYTEDKKDEYLEMLCEGQELL
jgi:DNA helicase IV